MSEFRAAMTALVALVLALGGNSLRAEVPSTNAPDSVTQAAFEFEEVMIPMRDGVHLQTVIMTPKNANAKLPILLRRTPYGVPEAGTPEIPSYFQELAKDGYIFVFQNLRGRFKSEGEFLISTKVDLDDPQAVNETTDGYDTIDWLVKHVPHNNGRVGITGVSYSGLTAGMALLHPHPALRAVSTQGAPTDQFFNDDLHRYGALRLSYAFEFAVLEQSEKHANAPFQFDTYDTYEWYLKLGSVANAQRYLKGELQLWNDIVAHPDYDDYWQQQAWVKQLTKAVVPTLTVAGFWDQEDPWGPWQIYRAAEMDDPGKINSIVAGPWIHGAWARSEGEAIGKVPLGAPTGLQFRRDIEAPFFAYWLHGIGKKPQWEARVFQTGSNVWKSESQWPPADVQPTKLFFHSSGLLSFSPPTGDDEETPYRSFVSDPANPVPYRPRPITPTFSSEGWNEWETIDQRFVDHRPDVLTYVSAPLEEDIVIGGPVEAILSASTSGTDSDMVVKLIDVFPESSDPVELSGYQFPIAMEVRRGRYLSSYDRPAPLEPNVPQTWDISLRDRAHVFKKGHRIMVQVQSSWFPVIDLNPQKYVPNIYEAKSEDFVKATQRIYATPKWESYITLPILPKQEEGQE